MAGLKEVLGQAVVELTTEDKTGPGLDKARKEVETQAKGMGEKFSDLGQKMRPVSVAAAGIAATAGVMAQGWSAAQKDMQASTGATGEELKGLMGSVQNVTGTVKGGAEAIGSVMAELAAKTGMSGPPLEDLTKRVMALKEVGVELAAADVTGAFGRWSIKAQEMGAALERVNKVAQETGVPLGILLGRLSEFQPVLQGLGFSFDDASLLVGRLSDVSLAGLKRALDTIVDTGTTDVPGAFAAMVASIKGAEEPAVGLGLAIDAFGVKAGPELYAQISKGKFGLEDLRDAVAANEGDSLKAAEANRTWLDQLGLFKDKAAAMLGPYAEKISMIAAGVAAISPAVEGIGKAIDWVKQLGDASKPVSDTIGGVGDGIKGISGAATGAGAGLTAMAGGTTAQGAAAGAAAAPTAAFSAALAPIAAIVFAIVFAIVALIAIFWLLTEQLGLSTADAIKIMLFLFGGPLGQLIALIMLVWENWDEIWGWICDRFKEAWAIIEEVLGFFVDRFNDLKDGIGDVVSWIWDKLKGAWDWIVDKAKEIIEWVGKAADALGDMAGKAVGGLFDMTPLGAGINLLKGDEGGVVPGPRGAGRLILAHGGETLIPTHQAGWSSDFTSLDGIGGGRGGSPTVVNINLVAKGHILHSRDAAREISHVANELRRYGFSG